MSKKDFQIVPTSNGGIGLATDAGVIFGRFSKQYADLAKKMARLPSIIEALSDVVDGAEGYVCEVGDGHPYWRENAVEHARNLLDALGEK